MPGLARNLNSMKVHMVGNTEFENGGDSLTLRGCILFYGGFSVIHLIILPHKNFNKMVITDQNLGPTSKFGPAFNHCGNGHSILLF